MSEDLPRANVKRIVKAKLLELAAAHYGDEKTSRDLPIHKDALLAFSESAKIFIHYLSATANDICRESKRQTINAEDVLRAVEEIEFGEFVEPLRSALEVYREENQNKKAQRGFAANGGKRKRRASDISALNGNEDGDEADNQGEEDEGEGEDLEDDKEEEADGEDGSDTSS
ncbi:DNA polymerase epsilon subunit 3 [Marchantia polymorpha subsp. ruderalis]|uniref:Transcription factor CBF/NF-Y/archaeal histone domain-containing protein n=2 Tax=Marchantia polymorpha TaxID=3197 RepID=A0A176WQI9_MARPO|nr:hypothetical protein AXG93_2528s1690 [Marchantia polymorpha subsp. ruderalis]PTQ31887.1 hypothetical protein MARPO_0105s0006 [Marchantia polymorpha]BBN04956.1 hypothetical protein Mp_3g09110 [Marchantia polymorpha subsp. ruderalis]|eukprot:PTQ31887.1 hypothetical protein MARPO_0105s0006 [Marchantia polymorpha]